MSELHINWSIGYAAAINGRFDLRGSYQPFTEAQRKRQLDRLTEWWAA